MEDSIEDTKSEIRRVSGVISCEYNKSGFVVLVWKHENFDVENIIKDKFGLKKVDEYSYNRTIRMFFTEN